MTPRSGRLKSAQFWLPVDDKVAKFKNGTDIRSAVILEKPRTNRVETDISRLFDDEGPRNLRLRNARR